MRTLTEAVGRLVTAHSRWIIGSFVLLTAGCLYLARNAHVDFDFRQFFPIGDPDVAIYDAFTEEFGKDDGLIIVALLADDVFTPPRLTRLRALTEAAADLPGVARSVSFANAPHLVGSLGEVSVEPFLPDDIPEDPPSLARIRSDALADPLVVGSFIAADATAAALVIDIEGSTTAEERVPVLEALDALLTTVTPTEFEVHVGGVPAVRSDYIALIERDTIVMWVLSALAMCLVLFLTFRSVSGVVLPGLTVTIAIVFTGALMGGLDRAITIMGAIMPVVIMITGVADSIHFISRYHEELGRGQTKLDALQTTVARLGIACLITSTTTAVGFAALATTNLVMLREYGLFTAFGVMCAYLVTILLLPACLAVLPVPERLRARANDDGWLSRRLDEIASLVSRRSHLVLAIGGLLIAVAAVAVTQIRKEARLLDDLSADNPILVTNRLLEAKLGGVLPLELVFDTGEADGISNPGSLAVVDRITSWLETREEVAWAFSTANLLREANAIFHDGDAAYRVVPATSRLAAQLIEAVGSSADATIDQFLEPARRKLRISARMRDAGSTRANAFFADLQATVQSVCSESGFPPGCMPITTGTTMIATRVNDYLVEQIFWSFLLAFGAITIMLGIVFSSWRLALLALPPNVVPMTATLAIMAAANVYLKPSTAIIFSIAFGIAVDDTIHFFVRLREEREGRTAMPEAVRKTLRGTGRAMVFTTAVLALGFLSGFVSEMTSNHNFAFLAIVTIVAALVADLLLAPALVIALRGWLGPASIGERKADEQPG